MRPSAELITESEKCQRSGFWSRDWINDRMTDVDFIQAGLQSAFLSKRADFNEEAGETVVGLARDRQLITSTPDQYSQLIHCAAIADILSMAIRKPTETPWRVPTPVGLSNGVSWAPSGLVAPSGTALRRVVLVSNWSDERHFHECRSWYSLGEICAYNLPQQLVVAVIGQRRSGKRHSWWTKGYRHPVNKGLRFRKKNDVATGFKETWQEIWREDYDDIETREWLDVMQKDGVLQDSLFVVDIPVPEKAARERILELAVRKLDKLMNLRELPDQNLSTCDWPVKCEFLIPCHKNDVPSGRYGFVPVDQL